MFDAAFIRPKTRLTTVLATVLGFVLLFLSHASAEGPVSGADLRARFEALSQHGNVECSVQFGKLIPPDPYDISARLAHTLMGYYTLALNKDEQAAYDYAMQHSDMQGPCCCKCWRWKVYGGLGKYLIRTRGYTGQQLTDLWNVGQGCGGPTDTKMH